MEPSQRLNQTLKVKHDDDVTSQLLSLLTFRSWLQALRVSRRRRFCFWEFQKIFFVVKNIQIPNVAEGNKERKKFNPKFNSTHVSD